MGASTFTPAQARTLFDTGAFFILPLERQGTEVGVDTSLWAVKSFAGFKFVPPGLHLFVYSSPPRASSNKEETSPIFAAGSGVSIRHGIWRFVTAGEVVVRKYDEAKEQVVKLERSESASGRQTSGIEELGEDEPAQKRLRPEASKKTPTSELIPRKPASSDSSLISKDQLKSLDPKLAPYPFEQQKEWQALTRFIAQDTLDSVLGSNEEGDIECDALMSSNIDEEEAQRRRGAVQVDQTSGRRIWGKQRPEAGTSVGDESLDSADMTIDAANAADPAGKTGVAEEGSMTGTLEEVLAEEAEKERTMRFASFDLKRSWRRGAQGEELSRNSRDKSWLLGEVARTQLYDSSTQLLAHLQLAFILFVQLQNFSALEAYKRYLTLLCRSSSCFLPTSQDSAASSCTLTPPAVLTLYAGFLQDVLVPHLLHLRNEFFTEDMPDLEPFFINELGSLRLNLRAANRHYTSSPSSTASFEPLRSAWSRLTEVAKSKFGWLLGGLDVDDVSAAMRPRTYDLLRADGDDEDEYVEEGEDAPVFVEL